MALKKFEELTDFQKWIFFYISKEEFAPVDLNGVMPKMCLTVRMKIDVDNYEEDTEKLIAEANELTKDGLLTVTNKYVPQGEFILTDKGELYLLQKILRPLIEIKEKDKIAEIRDYYKIEDDEVKKRVEILLDNTNPENPQKTISDISALVLTKAMPFLSALALIHEYARMLGLL